MTIMPQTTLLILLDAFRWDYLNPTDTPFLWSLAQTHHYVRQIQPGFGFCERAEMFTGARADVTRFFAAMTYAPSQAPLAAYRSLFRLLAPLDETLHGRFLRRPLLAYLRQQGHTFPIYRIPLRLLSDISLTEDARPHLSPGGLGVPSLFDRLYETGQTANATAFTALGFWNGDDAQRVQTLLNEAGRQHDFYLLYLGMTDAQAHWHGVHSSQRRAACQQADQYVSTICDTFQRQFSPFRLLIVGDHGMMDVRQTIDIGTAVSQMCRRYRLRPGRDFVLFLDSTLARFWFLQPHSRQPILDLLHQPPLRDQGFYLTEDLQAQWHVPMGTNLYGDAIWCAHPGVLLFPDYFHRTQRMRAMHGYPSTAPEMRGMSILAQWPPTSPRQTETADLIDICPTLCDWLHLPYPSTCQGRSLLE